MLRMGTNGKICHPGDNKEKNPHRHPSVQNIPKYPSNVIKTMNKTKKTV